MGLWVRQLSLTGESQLPTRSPIRKTKWRLPRQDSLGRPQASTRVHLHSRLPGSRYQLSPGSCAGISSFPHHVVLVSSEADVGHWMATALTVEVRRPGAETSDFPAGPCLGTHSLSLPSPATHAFWAKHRAVQRPGCWMRLAGVVKEDGFVNNRPGFRCCPFPDLVKMFASSIAVSVLGPEEVEDFFSCQMTQF